MVDARRKPETKPARYKPFPRIYTRGLVHVTLIASLPVVQTIRVSSIFQPARVSANPPIPTPFSLSLSLLFFPVSGHSVIILRSIPFAIKGESECRISTKVFFSLSLSFLSFFLNFHRILQNYSIYIYFWQIVRSWDSEANRCSRDLRSLTRFLWR